MFLTVCKIASKGDMCEKLHIGRYNLYCTYWLSNFLYTYFQLNASKYYVSSESMKWHVIFEEIIVVKAFIKIDYYNMYIIVLEINLNFLSDRLVENVPIKMYYIVNIKFIPFSWSRWRIGKRDFLHLISSN